MMTTVYTNKLHAGGAFPSIEAKLLNGESVKLGQPQNGLDGKWWWFTVAVIARFVLGI